MGAYSIARDGAQSLMMGACCIACNGARLLAMVLNRSRWCSIAHNGARLLTMELDCSQWCSIARNGAQSLAMVLDPGDGALVMVLNHDAMVLDHDGVG